MSARNAHCSKRDDGIDVLRGLFLVLMTLTHLPTSFSGALTQPFGQVSAAEGFVLLSALLAGRVYLGRGMRDGLPAMRRALWERAVRVYSHHLGLLVFGIAVILPLGLLQQEGAITGLFHLFLRNPDGAGAAALALVYQPPLFDILPMYVLFLLLTPWLLAHARRHGWALPLAASVAIWAAAQLGLREWVHAGLMQLLGLNWPVGATGAFNPLAWQLLWVVGLWLGSARLLGGDSPLRTPPRTVWLVAALALSLLVWRHAGGWHPLGSSADAIDWSDRLIGKWDLGPLRMLNVFAIAILLAAWGPQLMRGFRWGWLALLGRSSLAVFSTHLVCCLLALALIGPTTRSGGGLVLDLALLAASLLAMQATALIAQSRAGALGARLPAAREA